MVGWHHRLDGHELEQVGPAARGQLSARRVEVGEITGRHWVPSLDVDGKGG